MRCLFFLEPEPKAGGFPLGPFKPTEKVPWHPQKRRLPHPFCPLQTPTRWGDAIGHPKAPRISSGSEIFSVALFTKGSKRGISGSTSAGSWRVAMATDKKQKNVPHL